MKGYLINISHTYVTHNALHVAFMKFLKGLNRKIVPVEEIETFKKYFILIADDISKEFPRCKPISVYFQQSPDFFSGRDDISLGWNGHELCIMKFLATDLEAVSI